MDIFKKERDEFKKKFPNLDFDEYVNGQVDEKQEYDYWDAQHGLI